MPCVEVKTKKYQTRKGPPYHANDCKGQTKLGNDKKSYISSPDSRGIYKWILKQSHNTTKKRKGVKSYTILDNGAKPYVVDVSSSKIEVYLHKWTEETKWYRDKKILDIPYKKVFIGDNYLNDPYADKKGSSPGNTILVKTGQGKYTYIGEQVYSFETQNAEEIKDYYSPVGNSAVPYPYAVGETYSYFMLDQQTVPNDLLNLKEDGYQQFYGHSIKDENLKKKIDASKQKFKYKLIRKRMVY